MRLRIEVVVAALLAASVFNAQCSKAPTAPTAVTPPPVVAPVVPDPPELTCPSSVSVAAPTSAGIAVTFAAPEARKGQGSVSVSCTTASGTTFPIGTTQIECVATDSLNRTGSCTFSVNVAAPPRLRASRIMAFGDSTTAGQTVLGTDPYEFTVLPTSAYPAVLGQLLSARYTDQTITVFNRGLLGEQASRALSRFITAFIADRPDVVVLQEGYNDYNLSPIVGDVGIDAAIRGISELAGEARRRGARTFICTLAPGRPGRIMIPTSALLVINDRLRQVARGEGAVIIDLYSALLPEVNANVSIDGLHLTPLGYRRVAETVSAALRAELEVR